MATINALPHETLYMIMCMLKEPSLSWDDEATSPPGRYDALRAAALVYSRWRDPAQRALAVEIEISDLFPLRSQRLLAAPRPPRHRTTSLQAWSLSWPKVLEVAEVCDGLRVLSYTMYANMSWSELGRPCFAGLQNISMAAHRLIGAPLRPGDSLPTGLSSLALRTNFDEGASAFLATLSNASRPSLKNLRLRVYIGDSRSTVGQSLNAIGPNLQTVVLESYVSNGGRDSFLSIFPLLKSLRSFSWRGYDSSLPLHASNTADLRTILDAFPSPATLTHLSIGTDDLSSLEHIDTLLGHPALALLTKLDLPFLPATAPIGQAADVPAMAKACGDRGIRWSMGGREV